MFTQKYVVGFLFRKQNTEVALITKTKPEWQRGKLNGIGGKIEDGETPLQAQIREFEEETGELVVDWEPFLVMRLPSAEIHFFKSFGGDDSALRTVTDEEVGWFAVKSLFLPPNFIGGTGCTLNNLRWLVPMALDSDHYYGNSLSKEFIDAGVEQV